MYLTGRINIQHREFSIFVLNVPSYYELALREGSVGCVLRASIHSRNRSTMPSTLPFTSESQNRNTVNPIDSNFCCRT